MRKSFYAVIPNVLSSTLPFQFAGCRYFPKRPFDGAVTERGTELPDVLLDKTANLLLGGPAHGLQGREFDLHQRKAVGNVLVCGKNGPQQILDKRHNIFRTFMPSDLRLRRCSYPTFF